MNSASRILHNSDCDEREKEKEEISDNACGDESSGLFLQKINHAARGIPSNAD